MAIQQRKFKDRLFFIIFGRDDEDSKRWRLELYNALNETHYTDPDALKVNTLENVIYISMHNDVSFIVDNEMILFEQQSTFNPNMPLRGFLYENVSGNSHVLKGMKHSDKKIFLLCIRKEFDVTLSAVMTDHCKTGCLRSSDFRIIMNMHKAPVHLICFSWSGKISSTPVTLR